MAKLKDSLAKHYEELGLKFLHYLKFRLKQDDITFRDQILEWFSKWLMAKPKRLSRYEAADLKLVDEFIDFAWASIKDPSVPMPPQEPEPPKRAAARAGNWWGNPEAQAEGVINWREVARQIAQAPPPNFRVDNGIGQQWIMFDEHGNPVNR